VLPPSAQFRNFTDKSGLTHLHFRPENRIRDLESDSAPTPETVASDEENGSTIGLLTRQTGQAVENISKRGRIVQRSKTNRKAVGPREPFLSGDEFTIEPSLCLHRLALALLGGASDSIEVTLHRLDFHSCVLSRLPGSSEVALHRFDVDSSLF
jgi:hypothetical protein